MASEEGERTGRPGVLRTRLILPLALALAAACGFAALSDFDIFGTLRAHGGAALTWAGAHPMSAMLLYVALFVLLVALSLPGAFAMTITGGFLFGLAAGTALAVVSATLGAIGVFLAVRLGFGEAVRRWLGAGRLAGAFTRLEQGLRENGVSYLLLLRLVPAVPFPVANIAPAFLGVPVHTFAATTLVGITPGTALTAWIGQGLHEVFARGGRPDLDLLHRPEVLGPLAGLVLLVSLPLGMKRLRRH